MTRACCTGGGAKGERLAAVALNDKVRRMPLVDPSEGDFEGFVVRLDVLDDLGHSQWSLPVVCRGRVGWAKGDIASIAPIITNLLYTHMYSRSTLGSTQN